MAVEISGLLLQVLGTYERAVKTVRNSGGELNCSFNFQIHGVHDLQLRFPLLLVVNEGQNVPIVLIL